jgi:phospholipase C
MAIVHAAFGGSFLNHIWLVCACSPRYDEAPAALVATEDAQGRMIKDGAVTPDGYAVNTIQSIYMPHSPKITDKSKLLPPQTDATIGDRLSDKGVDWAWYSGGWNDAVAGYPGELFQFHHQPFAYFKQFGDGTAAKAAHLKDEAEFLKAIDDGSLPPVAFYKPYASDNEHPGYADVLTGDQHTAALIARFQTSPVWKDSVIIVTYDENGGTWDHVAPPIVDKWGPGTRIPTIIVSPRAKRGLVDHTPYDTTSILKLIETRFQLPPLTSRDAGANDLTNALDLH